MGWIAYLGLKEVSSSMAFEFEIPCTVESLDQIARCVQGTHLYIVFEAEAQSILFSKPSGMSLSL